MKTVATAEPPTYTAFSSSREVASGEQESVLRALKKKFGRVNGSVLIFEDQTGRQVDFDFRGTADEVVARASDAPKSGPGRPKLGVTSREVSLLPRHWDWLESQPNGISAAIRRLVDEARHNESGVERGRHVRDAVGRVMWAIAGDLPNLEEAGRALYAREDKRLAKLMDAWPKDVQSYVLRRVKEAALFEAW
ncbi:MAG TPA: DUF2239 family protein [Gemmatimonadaceae bacterium]